MAPTSPAALGTPNRLRSPPPGQSGTAPRNSHSTAQASVPRARNHDLHHRALSSPHHRAPHTTPPRSPRHLAPTPPHLPAPPLPQCRGSSRLAVPATSAAQTAALWHVTRAPHVHSAVNRRAGQRRRGNRAQDNEGWGDRSGVRLHVAPSGARQNRCRRAARSTQLATARPRRACPGCPVPPIPPGAIRVAHAQRRQHRASQATDSLPRYPPPSAFARAPRRFTPNQQNPALLLSTPRASDARSTGWNGGCEEPRQPRLDPGTTGARDVVEQG
ncbi:hypothetical protein PLICRDRAFT_175086 [Plicaturopsis crispa FD-325 SS-3]|nr:hypothetical protein PLICRDRAFT_175086 [Plicaturopsis crispa FD-325 SS-3]